MLFYENIIFGLKKENSPLSDTIDQGISFYAPFPNFSGSAAIRPFEASLARPTPLEEPMQGSATAKIAPNNAKNIAIIFSPH